MEDIDEFIGAGQQDVPESDIMAELDSIIQAEYEAQFPTVPVTVPPTVPDIKYPIVPTETPVTAIVPQPEEKKESSRTLVSA